MKVPRYVQRRRTKGWRMPKGAVNCTRPGPLGNPFMVILGQNRLEVVLRFKRWIARRSSGDPWHEQRVQMLSLLPGLRGRDLVCWCKPGTPCHVQDVLLPLANGETIHDCEGYCGGRFLCDLCKRVLGDCLGADDKTEREHGPICDECARKLAA